MDDPVLREQIAAAEAYENLHVPALFRTWAPRLADLADLGPGRRVLDVACGTGVLAREARSRVGERGRVQGLDPVRGMLEVARRLAPDVDWTEGTAEALPFPDRTFDAVVSQFGMMFFEDRWAAASEMHRVLTPGGRVAVAVWAGLETCEAYADLVGLVERAAGSEAAAALSAPFAFERREDLAAPFESAGFDLVAAETEIGAACFPAIRTMVEADLRGWLPLMGVVLDEVPIRKILSEAEQVLARFVTPEGAVRFDIGAHLVTGTRS